MLRARVEVVVEELLDLALALARGWLVDGELDAPAAIALLDIATPALILLDVRLDDGTGFGRPHVRRAGLTLDPRPC